MTIDHASINLDFPGQLFLNCIKIVPYREISGNRAYMRSFIAFTSLAHHYSFSADSRSLCILRLNKLVILTVQIDN